MWEQTLGFEIHEVVGSMFMGDFQFFGNLGKKRVWFNSLISRSYATVFIGDLQSLVCGDIFDNLHVSIRPYYFHTICFWRLAQSEMYFVAHMGFISTRGIMLMKLHGWGVGVRM